MKGISDLKEMLSSFLIWDKRHIVCIVYFLVGLFKSRNVNMKRIAQMAPCSSNKASCYRRFQRFLSGVRFDYGVIAKLLYQLFDFENQSYYLTMDRTSWRWGLFNINIFFICIETQKRAIPILWLILRKKGNTNTKQRIAMINRFISWFGRANILGVLADREFIGKAWFKHLKKQKIPFYIRVKSNTKVTNSQGTPVNASHLFHDLKPNEKRYLGLRKLYGMTLYITAARANEDSELMIIVSEQSDPNAIDIYLNRWPIETFFFCLKSRGFNFEETRVFQRHRLKKLIAILAIGYAWAIKIGLWLHHVKPIKLKKHGRPALSVFRYGLDWIIDTFMQASAMKISMLNQFIAIIEKTPNHSKLTLRETGL